MLFHEPKRLDTNRLPIARVGFQLLDDLRVCGTLEAIVKRLLRERFVLRYQAEGGAGALGGDELTEVR